MSYDMFMELIGDIDIVTKTDKEEFAIPIAIANEKELIHIEFTQQCGVSLISGFPGSGKSTMIRLIIAALLKNKEQTPFEIYLADTTGYEFPEMLEKESRQLKGTLFGLEERNIKNFIDKLHQRFIEKMDRVIHNSLDIVEKDAELKDEPTTFVFVDDGYIMLEELSSQEYIDKFRMIITHGAICGIYLVLLSQVQGAIYRKMPLLREVVGQIIFLSPYAQNDLLKLGNRDIIFDGYNLNGLDRFSVAIAKRNQEQMERGKLFYITPEELKLLL